MTTDDDLVAACTRFRTALDEQEAMPANVKDFPLGACGDTTEMLGQYLDDRGFGVWMYIQGHRDTDGWTHAWLERDGVVIDITADQFEDVTEPVIVSATSTWHGTEFRPVSSPRPANMSFFADRTTQTEMNELYAAVSRRADDLKAT